MAGGTNHRATLFNVGCCEGFRMPAIDGGDMASGSASESLQGRNPRDRDRSGRPMGI